MQMNEMITRLESDVNATVSEIALEMEIIVLEDFQTASSKLDVQVNDILAPTTAILDAYTELLAQLLPDVSSLASESGIDEAAAQAATSQSFITENKNVNKQQPVRVLNRDVRKTTVTSLHVEEEEERRNKVDDDSKSSSFWRLDSLGGSSPVTSLLVVVGALFAGVAFAGNNAGGSRVAEYESLL
jgi:hypothetical protein